MQQETWWQQQRQQQLPHNHHQARLVTLDAQQQRKPNYHAAEDYTADGKDDAHTCTCTHVHAYEARGCMWGADSGQHVHPRQIPVGARMLMLMFPCRTNSDFCKGHIRLPKTSFDFKTRLATLCQGFALTHPHTLRNCCQI